MKVDVATGSGGSEPGSDLEDRTSPHARREPVPYVGSHLHDAARPAPMVRVLGVRPRRSAPLLGCLDLSHRPSVVVEAGSIPGGHVRARHGPNAVGRRRRSRWRRRTGIEPARELVAPSSVLKTAGPTRNPDASTPEDSGAGSEARGVRSPRDGAGAAEATTHRPDPGEGPRREPRDRRCSLVDADGEPRVLQRAGRADPRASVRRGADEPPRSSRGRSSRSTRRASRSRSRTSRSATAFRTGIPSHGHLRIEAVDGRTRDLEVVGHALCSPRRISSSADWPSSGSGPGRPDVRARFWGSRGSLGVAGSGHRPHRREHVVRRGAARRREPRDPRFRDGDPGARGVTRRHGAEADRHPARAICTWIIWRASGSSRRFGIRAPSSTSGDRRRRHGRCPIGSRSTSRRRCSPCGCAEVPARVAAPRRSRRAVDARLGDDHRSPDHPPRPDRGVSHRGRGTEPRLPHRPRAGALGRSLDGGSPSGSPGSRWPPGPTC